MKSFKSFVENRHLNESIQKVDKLFHHRRVASPFAYISEFFDAMAFYENAEPEVAGQTATPVAQPNPSQATPAADQGQQGGLWHTVKNLWSKFMNGNPAAMATQQADQGYKSVVHALNTFSQQLKNSNNPQSTQAAQTAVDGLLQTLQNQETHKAIMAALTPQQQPGQQQQPQAGQGNQAQQPLGQQTGVAGQAASN